MGNKIIVLIPHFNDNERLMFTLSSISNKINVDVLIVDDGSKIYPDEIILNEKFKNKIGCIKVIVEPKNKGIEHVLNVGLKYIHKITSYKYIARLDCGDLCHEDRFIHQYNFLEKNKEIALVSSNYKLLYQDGRKNGLIVQPENHSEIIKIIHYRNPFTHVSVMFKRIVLDEVGYYPTEYKANEDYAYWFKIISKFKSANINKELVYCEVRESGITIGGGRKRVLITIKLLIDNWSWRYFTYSLMGVFRRLIIVLIGIKTINRLIRFLQKIFKK